MSIQFEWQAGRDDGQWEIIAESQRGPVRRWLNRLPWWAWVLVGLAVVGLGVLGYFNVRRRYEERLQQITFQIQSVIDLEARAFAEGDADLFVDQQDPREPEWLALQGRRVQPDCATARGGTGASGRTVLAICAPVLPAEVQDVELRGDIAWVTVIESLPADPARFLPVREVKRARFYRQTDLGWKHTAPPAAFWQGAIRVDYGSLFVLYHKRDQPYVEYLEETITDAFKGVCKTLTCSSRNTLTVDFSVDPPPYDAPAIEIAPGPEGEDQITLSSPWLAGIPVGEEQDERLIKELAQAVTYATAARSIQYTTELVLTDLQRAILDEYAAWYAYGPGTELVLLRSLAEERGIEAMPDALLMALEPGRSPLSLDEEGTSPEEVVAYFQGLLNTEREALLAGRKETFMMLQDEGWKSLQEKYYWLAQESETLIPNKPVLVESAQASGEFARVQVAEPLPSVDKLPPQSLGSMVYLRQQGGEWRHASALDGYTWPFPPPLTPTPTPTPAAGQDSD